MDLLMRTPSLVAWLWPLLLGISDFCQLATEWIYLRTVCFRWRMSSHEPDFERPSDSPEDEDVRPLGDEESDSRSSDSDVEGQEERPKSAKTVNFGDMVDHDALTSALKFYSRVDKKEHILLLKLTFQFGMSWPISGKMARGSVC